MIVLIFLYHWQGLYLTFTFVGLCIQLTNSPLWWWLSFMVILMVMVSLHTIICLGGDFTLCFCRLKVTKTFVQCVWLIISLIYHSNGSLESLSLDDCLWICFWRRLHCLRNWYALSSNKDEYLYKLWVKTICHNICDCCYEVDLHYHDCSYVLINSFPLTTILNTSVIYFIHG